MNLDYIVFRSKVLESHSERVYGSKIEDSSSESESDSSPRESSPPQLCQHRPQAGLVAAESAGDLDRGVSLHKQHERFMDKQIQLATSYKEKHKHLPRTISSKRSATNEGESCEGFVSRKKERLSSSEVEGPAEQESGIRKGPRTVSRAEKNKRRKLKKKKRLARKS
jgi:hypothetical protein